MQDLHARQRRSGEPSQMDLTSQSVSVRGSEGSCMATVQDHANVEDIASCGPIVTVAGGNLVVLARACWGLGLEMARAPGEAAGGRP